MKSFTPSFADRRNRAADARKAALDRFRSKPDANDPTVLARQAERQATQAAREKRAAERLATQQADEQAAAAERAAAETIRAVEAAERAGRDAARQVEQKAMRDARYAARKARQS